MQDSPWHLWVLSPAGRSPAWPSPRESGLRRGDAQPDHGGYTLPPEPCRARRCSETGPAVTYFRGVLRTSVTMAMRLRANIMGFLVKVFAFNQSQKPDSRTKVLGVLQEMALNNSNDSKGLHRPWVSATRAVMVDARVS